jgi:hypothetical protein
LNFTFRLSLLYHCGNRNSRTGQQFVSIGGRGPHRLQTARFITRTLANPRARNASENSS